MLTFHGNHGSWRSVLEGFLKILHKNEFKMYYCYVLKIFSVSEFNISLETTYPTINEKSEK